MIRLILLLCALSFGEKTHQDLIDLVGRKGDITHIYDLYLGLDSLRGYLQPKEYGLKFPGLHSTTQSQVGLYLSPTFYSANVGADGLRIEPHIQGFSSYSTMLAIYPPVLDSAGSTANLTALDIMDVIGGDSSNYAMVTRKGRVLIGDTLSASRLFQQGGGEQIHATLIRQSRQLKSDTDHVLIGLPDTTRLRDTLPLLSNALGQDYLFILYHQSTSDSGWVIYPHAGEKIDSYDSVILQSNLGKGYLHILGLGDRWRVMSHHEEGYATLTMATGVSGTNNTNCIYSIDNLLDVKLRIAPVSGTSNSTANTFSLTGLNSRFTDPLLDTTWNSESSAIGLDSIPASLQCVMYGSGSSVKCYRNDFAAFRGNGPKGLVYGLNFQFRLQNPAPHL